MGLVAGTGEEVKWPMQWSYSSSLMWQSVYKSEREGGGWAGAAGVPRGARSCCISVGRVKEEMCCAVPG